MGYAGGTKADPTYHSLGDHTETTEMDFDPSKISYEEILNVFWKSHNPCAASYSRQYMSAVFTRSEEQKRVALATKAREEKRLGKPIQTPVLPLTRFYLAEDYHQKYYLRNSPELAAEFRRLFPKDEEFVNSTAAARVNGLIGGYGSAAQLREELEGWGLSPQARQKLQAYLRR